MNAIGPPTSRIARTALRASALVAVVAGVGAACTIWNGVSLPDAPPSDAGPSSPVDGGSTQRGYAAEVLADAPIAYWRFAPLTDPSRRAIADVTAGSRTCTLSTGVGIEAGPLTGGSSLRFGNADSASCSPSGDDTFSFEGLLPFTIELFLAPGPNTTDATEFRSFVDHMMGTSPETRRGYFGYLNRDASRPMWRLAFEIWHGTGASDIDYVGTDPSMSFRTDVWRHVVVTRDGAGALSLYIDGALASSASSRALPETSDIRLAIGRNQNNSCCGFQGRIAELAIFGKALAARDVSRHVTAARAEGFAP